jgi:hypothetical protein
VAILRSLDAQRDGCQCSLVEDDFNTVDRSRAGDWVGRVAVNEFKVTVDMGEVLKRPGTQIVQDTDIVTLFNESGDNVRPYESRTAGYQIVGHSFVLSQRVRFSLSVSRPVHVRKSTHCSPQRRFPTAEL